MIKKNRVSLILASLILLGFLFYTKENSFFQAKSSLTTVRAKIYHPHLSAKSGALMNDQQPLQAMMPINKRTDFWQKNLETTLTRLGGKDLKSIDIKRVDSFIWKQQNLLLNVESVLVRLYNQKGEETSFRAIVDAQNGKILQTWDQPVIDHINARDTFGIRLDSRYLE